MNEAQIKDILSEVKDPEVPVLSILDLGIVRKIDLQGEVLNIDITPTYSGCPAMDTIEQDMRIVLKEHGFLNINIKHVLSPPWTTDWLSEEGRKKLEEYGIAPPVKNSVSKKGLMGLDEEIVKCPKCKSLNTKKISHFGSTACKALFQCQDCQEPFDYFKCL